MRPLGLGTNGCNAIDMPNDREKVEMKGFLCPLDLCRHHVEGLVSEALKGRDRDRDRDWDRGNYQFKRGNS
jgi:hypothetical protein